MSIKFKGVSTYRYLLGKKKYIWVAVLMQILKIKVL